MKPQIPSNVLQFMSIRSPSPLGPSLYHHPTLQPKTSIRPSPEASLFHLCTPLLSSLKAKRLFAHLYVAKGLDVPRKYEQPYIRALALAVPSAQPHLWNLWKLVLFFSYKRMNTYMQMICMDVIQF
jgi:hypothetical protein